MSEPRTLVIGDTHGRLDVLATLLIQEGVVDPGTLKRVDRDVRVVHVGDLGNFADDKTADRLTYAVADDWLDTLLWGNHDRSVISPMITFNHFERPDEQTLKSMNDLRLSGKLVLATTAHGFLVTHAGLHVAYGRRHFDHLSPNVVAGKINYEDTQYGDMSALSSIWTAIAIPRGGAADAGGILWRDVREKLWEGARQVFGHSVMRDGIVRAVGYDGTFNVKRGQEPSYAIDVGAKQREQQAGIWLPEERVVAVGPSELSDLYYGRDRS